MSNDAKRGRQLWIGQAVEPFIRGGIEAQRAVDELGAGGQGREFSDGQIAKLFVARIHRIAARVQDPQLRIELYELADDVEERLGR